MIAASPELKLNQAHPLLSVNCKESNARWKNTSETELARFSLEKYAEGVG